MRNTGMKVEDKTLLLRTLSMRLSLYIKLLKTNAHTITALGEKAKYSDSNINRH